MFVRVMLLSAAVFIECTEPSGTTEDEGHVGGQRVRHVHSRRARNCCWHPLSRDVHR